MKNICFLKAERLGKNTANFSRFIMKIEEGRMIESGRRVELTNCIAKLIMSALRFVIPLSPQKQNVSPSHPQQVVKRRSVQGIRGFFSGYPTSVSSHLSIGRSGEGNQPTSLNQNFQCICTFITALYRGSNSVNKCFIIVISPPSSHSLPRQKIKDRNIPTSTSIR